MSFNTDRILKGYLEYTRKHSDLGRTRLMKNYLQIFLILILLFFPFSGCKALHQAQIDRQKKRMEKLVYHADNLRQKNDTKLPYHTWQEEKVHQLVNQYRQQVGLRTLSLKSEISVVARQHSQNMADKVVSFGHEEFQKRTDEIKTQIMFKRTSENVAMNNSPIPAQVAVRGWINSEGHKKNMEGDYDLTGVGIARSRNGSWYFTQIFVSTY